ncbi:MAG: flavin reductase family protein [Hyphomonadaceae bacterium]
MAESHLEPTVAETLKAAMRGLASSVSIISTGDKHGQRAAMTATSATSLTFDPPAMLVCINRDAWIYGILREDANFCINVLGADQLALAQACGGRIKGPDRFAMGVWRDEEGVPVLADAQAAILCGQARRLSFGTHDIIVGNVKKVVLGESIDPLLYINGAYKRVGMAV